MNADYPGKTFSHAKGAKAQKRQRLKEALPTGSVSGSGMFRLRRSTQLGVVFCCPWFGSAAVISDLAGAYLFTFVVLCAGIDMAFVVVFGAVVSACIFQRIFLC
jgi:hypothetical protein